jgi:TRAP transporter TAXI family solute receptor
LAQRSGWPASITIGTGSPGGPYYVYGQEIARVLSRDLGVEATAQVTQGPAQNIVLLEKRDVMLGFITTGVGLQAWNGAAWAKGHKYRAMRVVFPMYETAFQFAAPKRLGIKSLKELAGLRVGTGPRAGTSGTYVPEIFKVLGIQAQVRSGSLAQQTTLAINGELDAVAFASGFPFPALLAAAHTMEFLQPSAEEVGIIRKQFPELSTSVVPAGTYPFLVADYHTIGAFNFAIVHKDLPDRPCHGEGRVREEPGTRQGTGIGHRDCAGKYQSQYGPALASGRNSLLSGNRDRDPIRLRWSKLRSKPRRGGPPDHRQRTLK